MIKRIIFFFVLINLFSCSDNKNSDDNKGFALIDAVPIGSTLIIETQSLEKLKNKISSSQAWKNTKDFHWNKSVNNFFSETLKIIPAKDYSENFIITSTLSGGTSFDFLLLKYIEEQDEIEYSNRLKKLYSQTVAEYDKVKLYKLQKEDGEFYFAMHKNILLLSHEKLLVEEGIRQLNSNSSILENKEFKKLYESTDSNKDANIFIQFSDLNQLTKNYFQKADTKWTKYLADWATLEIDFNDGIIEMVGVTLADYVKSTYGTVFNDIEAQQKQIINTLPASTNALLYISLGEFESFTKNYDRYLNTSEVLFEKEKNLKKYKEYNPISEFSKWIGNELVVAYISEKTERILNQLLIVKSKDDIIAKDVLKTISNEAFNYRGFEMYNLNDENVLQDVFGNYVDDFKSSYFIFIEDYVVFANSVNTLKNYVNEILLQNYFIKNESNYKFIENFNSEAHVFAMSRGSEGVSLIESFLSDNYTKDYVKNKSSLSNFNYFGLQVNFDKHIGFTQAFIDINTSHSKNSKFASQLWNQNFKSDIKHINIVKNHISKSQEFAVQDFSNNLYLVSNKGEILWTKEFDEPILGEIQQIDIFKNGRLQLIFNTSSKLYVLDRKGDFVKPFPISLSVPASAGCGLFDYEKTKNYRILIPQGETMTMYSQSGNIVQGFKYTLNKNINNCPKHIRLGNKDYIVTTSTDGYLIILNRTGSVRVDVKDEFDFKDGFKFINNKIVFQTNDNKTVEVDFNGKVNQVSNSSENKLTDQFKSGTLRILEDEVIVDGRDLSIKHDLDEVNEYSFNFYEDNESEFLVIIDDTLKQVLVINSDEEVLNGFPVFGESIAQIYSENGIYYLLTKSSIDNSLIYYQLK